MTYQLALDFERLTGKGPDVERFQVETIIATLRGKDWQTAKRIP